MPGNLFDPKKMRGSPPAGGGDAIGPGVSGGSMGGGGDGTLTVSALCAAISDALSRRLPRTIRVVGEVSGFRDRSHWYFDLKDEQSVIACVMFSSASRSVSFPLENGLKVVAEGRVDFFARQGKTQVYVERLVPIGAGALELRFRRLVEELRALGWFEAARKKRLPAFAKRIAVVTSRTGAALQDVIDTARRRCPLVELAVVDVRVQGDAASAEIARALGWLGRRGRSMGIDAIILTRGGGSMEDLWAFNERIVAEAIVGCPLPIVAAIGHETDTTIAELVADERCATPTQAAMRLVPDGAGLLEQIDALAARMSAELRRRLRLESQRLRGIARLAWLSDPMSAIDDGRSRLASMERHLGSAMRHRTQRERVVLGELGMRVARGRPEAVYAARRAALESIQRRIARAARARLTLDAADQAERMLADAIDRSLGLRRDRLDAMQRELVLCGPEHVLRRGYSITTRSDGAVVRSARELASGQAITTRVADGSFSSVVGDASAGADSADRAVPAPAERLPARIGWPRETRGRRRGGRRGPERRGDGGQMGLF